jgi:hypothetical protein
VTSTEEQNHALGIFGACGGLTSRPWPKDSGASVFTSSGPTDIRPALATALAADRPVVIDVHTDDATTAIPAWGP